MGTGRARRFVGLQAIAAAALLGPARRDARALPNRAPWRDRTASSFEAPLAAADPLQFGRAAQLPPFGRGNGLEALFWTPLARLEADRVDDLLLALRRDGIAGWAAPVRRPGSADGGVPHDLWVGSLALDAAQDVLMRELAARR